MKVISTNIAQPREVIWNGTPVMTGIYKVPVDALTIRKYYVEGDTVSDPEVHGGEYKAVYGYPSEHYPFWRREFPKMEMPSSNRTSLSSKNYLTVSNMFSTFRQVAPQVFNGSVWN